VDKAQFPIGIARYILIHYQSGG